MTSPVTFWTVPRERALARHAEANRDEAILWERIRVRVTSLTFDCPPRAMQRECLAIADRCERQIGGA